MNCEDEIEMDTFLLGEIFSYTSMLCSQSYCHHFASDALPEMCPAVKEEPSELGNRYPIVNVYLLVRYHNRVHGVLKRHLLNMSAITNTPAISKEYLPYIRRICQYEEERKQSNTKRRFTHYLSRTTLSSEDIQALVQSSF